MAKVILAVGVLASVLLGVALGKRVERAELPRPGFWMTIVDSAGDGRLQIVGTWDDREDVSYVAKHAPASFWPLVRERDDFRVRRRSLTFPGTGWTLIQLQWEIRRGRETFEFGHPPAWRFWGILGSASAAPLVLSVVAAGAVALASGKKGTNP